MVDVATFVPVDWIPVRDTLDAALDALPPLYRISASQLFARDPATDSVSGYLPASGARYTAAVPAPTPLATWQARLAANRAAWEASLLPIYEAALRGWRTAPDSTFAGLANPESVALPVSVDELPAVRAARTLIDAGLLPAVHVAAREPGLWGNTVDVRVVDLGGGSLQLEARRGTTVRTAPVPAVGAAWRFTAPGDPDPWPDDEGIGVLIEQPTWDALASAPPAPTPWTALAGGAGLVLARLMAETMRFRAQFTSTTEIIYPHGALAALLYRTPFELVSVGGVLHYVPAGVADVLSPPLPRGSLAALFAADAELRTLVERAQEATIALTA